MTSPGIYWAELQTPEFFGTHALGSQPVYLKGQDHTLNPILAYLRGQALMPHRETDDFNRISLGANWQIVQNTPQILNNKLRGESVTINKLYWIGSPYGPNQYSQAKMYSTAAGSWRGVTCRNSGTSPADHKAYVLGISSCGTSVQLRYWWQHDSTWGYYLDANFQTVSCVEGSTLRLEVTGQDPNIVLKAYINGVLVSTLAQANFADQAAIINSGNPGLYIHQPLYDVEDDWEGSDLDHRLSAYLKGGLISSRPAYTSGTSEGTPASSSQVVYLKGEDYGSTQLSGYLWGLDYLVGQLDGYLRGQLDLSGYQPGFSAGGQLASTSRDAFLAGGEPVSDTQGAYLAGQDTGQAAQAVYLTSQDVSSSAQEGYTVGQDVATSSLPAFSEGLAPTGLSQQSVYVKGHDHVSSDQPGYATGSQTSQSSTPAYLKAANAANAAFSAYLEGFTPGTSAIIAWLRGADSAGSTTPAFLAGQVTSAQPAYLSGGVYASSVQDAYTAGQSDLRSQQTAYARGQETGESQQAGYACGQSQGYSQEASFLAGVATASGSQTAYLQGITGTSSMPAFLVGISFEEEGYLPAYLKGSRRAIPIEGEFITTTVSIEGKFSHEVALDGEFSHEVMLEGEFDIEYNIAGSSSGM